MGMLIAIIWCFITIGVCWVIVIPLLKKKEWPIVFAVFTTASLSFFTLLYGYLIFNGIKQKIWTPEYKVNYLYPKGVGASVKWFTRLSLEKSKLR